MPKPRPEESKDEFLSRCMASTESRRTFPDQAQRYAFCNSRWESSRKKRKNEPRMDDIFRKIKGMFRKGLY